MLKIKRLYTFMLQTFLAVVSYDIRYLSVYCVDAISLAIHRDMVGKGLGIPVLAEMFMYAALFLVPMALPLAILLAH